MTQFPYLHGFSDVEQDRLYRQSRFSEQSIFSTIEFSREKRLLEVGVGVGAQTEIMLRRFPGIEIVGIDLSERQLDAARLRLNSVPGSSGRFELKRMDAGEMEFETDEFDCAFVCWILEHAPQPARILSEIRRVLKPGSPVVLNEVMNSSFFLEPYSPNTWKYWMAYNDYQLEQEGDPFIGAKLGNMLLQQGYEKIETEVKIWHLDNRRPAERREVIRFWTELLLSASDQLIENNKIDVETVDGMKAELKTVAHDPNAVFFFAFMQARAVV
ncbi:MAG: class I SAM-dependent methyltransferase [Pirellulaceae bacterium]